MMKHRYYLLILVSLWLLIAKLSFAVDLIGVYQQALKHDPQFQIATSTRLSDSELAPIAHAALMPNIDVSGSATYSHEDTGDPTTNGTVADYSLSLKQPLFNYGNWINYEASEDKVKAANATYLAALQDLMVQVSSAYFSTLQAQEDLRLSKANTALLAKRLHQTLLQFKAGLSKTADVDNARAALDSSRAEVVHDQNALTVAMAKLQGITGVENKLFAPVKTRFPLQSPQPNNLNTWLQVVAKKNLTVVADRYSAMAAQKNIQQQAAGNYPTLDANASYGGNYSRNNGIASTNTHAGSVGLSLDFPIYQGGLVVAQTRQAQYDYETAKGQEMKDYFAARSQAQQAYAGVLNDIRAIKLDRLAVASNERSYKSTVIAYQAGTRNMIDLLTAQQALFSAEQSYVKDKYQYFIDFLNLKQAAGLLSVVDVRRLNRWLS